MENMNGILMRSGARVRLGGQLLEFIGIGFRGGYLRIMFRDFEGKVYYETPEWLEQKFAEFAPSIGARTGAQTIELPCPGGYTLCAETSEDSDDYPAIYVYTRKNGIVVDLCAVEYQTEAPEPGVHNVFLYERPETDEYTRKVDIVVPPDIE